MKMAFSAGLLHQGCIDLIGLEQIVAGGGILVMHGNPCIGYHAGGAGNGHFGRRRDRDIRTVRCAPISQASGLSESGWRGDAQLASKARYRACTKEAATLLPSPTQAISLFFEAAAMLFQGQDVGHDLAGMRLVGEAVDDRNGGVAAPAP